MFGQAHNIGGTISAADAGVAFNAVAGGGNDNSLQTGVILDRLLFSNPLSCSLLISWLAVLAAAATLTLTWSLEHGEDSGLSDSAAWASGAAAVIATGPSGGGTKHGVSKNDIDLGGAKRYVRVKVTTDLSAATTDTSVAAAVLVFGGEDKLPAA